MGFGCGFLAHCCDVLAHQAYPSVAAASAQRTQGRSTAGLKGGVEDG